MSYPDRVRQNILPLSVSNKLPEAFDEWHFTGLTEDHTVANETCRLCDQEHLRYHFQIQNAQTSHCLDVGSHCILKFDVAVFKEDGTTRLSPKDAKKRLGELTNEMRRTSCLNALEALAQKEPNDILTNALSYYRRKNKLTPKLAFVVFWKLQDNNIDHSPSFFSISLKRQDHIAALKEMDTWRVHKFWKALTAAQREKAIGMGHTPPE